MAVMQASESSINFVKTRLASPDGKLWGKAPGMVLIKPTSIAHSGTSASIGENGQVTFNAVTSLSLNGVFSAGFDNYMLVISGIATDDASIRIRLRASGTDASGASDYVLQFINANGTTTVLANRFTQSYAQIGSLQSSVMSGMTAFVYGPYLAQPTAFRGVTAEGLSAGVRIFDGANTHSLSTSYDGFTLYNKTITGKLAVYGVRS